MRKFFVSAALVAAVAAPLQAQDGVVTGHPSVFSIVPYAGYMVYGDHFKVTGAEFSNDNSWIVGAQAGLDFSPNFSIVGNFGWSQTRWEFETEDGTDIASGDVGIWLYDANIQLKLPFGTGPGSVMTPFLQAGIGAIKFSTDDNDFESEGQSNIAFNAGIGLDWQFRGVGIRLMAKDYISSFSWDDIEDLDEGNAFSAETSHNFALTAGLKIGF